MLIQSQGKLLEFGFSAQNKIIWDGINNHIID